MTLRSLSWIGILLVTTTGMRAAEPLQRESDRTHAAQVIECLQPPLLVQGEPRPCTTLMARMAELKVPGVSIAILHLGALMWAEGFGSRSHDGER